MTKLNSSWIWISVAVAILLVVLAIKRNVSTRGAGSRSLVEPPKATQSVVGKGAQPMFFKLTESFPDLIVLCEVAFSALLYAKSNGARNTYNRLRTDFVLVDKSFRVVAVIELDDSTHQSENAKVRDAQRDVMLERAGYKVLRYRQVPDVVRLRKDIQLTSTTAVKK